MVPFNSLDQITERPISEIRGAAGWPCRREKLEIVLG